MEDRVTTIHFGLDESNHCPPDRKYCEIIVATASTLDRDGAIRAPRKKRNTRFRNAWMDDPTKDWAFTLLTFDQFIKTPYNLVLVAPELVDRLCTNCLPEGGKVKAVLHMDGRVKKRWRNLLKSDLEGYFDHAYVKQHIKGSRYRKMPHYPNVVHAADNIANYLYKGNLQNITSHPRYVPLRLKELLKRQKRLESSQ